MRKRRGAAWKVDEKHRPLVLRFLEDGLADYLAARVLLNSGLLAQGAILGCTAIEKYFKAILATKGNQAHGHLKNAHWAGVKHIAPDLYARMNLSFFKLCQKCYDMRYSDQLPVGYNVAIAGREFLCELDITCLLIEESVERGDSDLKPVTTRFARLLEQRDERLLLNNHVLAKVSRMDFLHSEPQLVFEFRRLPNGAFLEASYTSHSSADEPSLTRAALVPKGDDGRSFTFSHLPLGNIPPT